MAGEWRRHEVSQLMADGKLVIGDGYRAKNDELASRGLPFARAGNINNGFRFDDTDHFPEENLARVGNKVSQTGDVVFTSKGTVGRFAFVRQTTPRFVYSPQLCFWRSLDHHKIDPRFLYYWMLGREFFVQFKGVAGQTDMAEYVSLTDQRWMQITLPTLPEQRAIAHILGTLDDKIELNRRMNETLEAMARAIFKSWFVDFDPVRAKAEGRQPPGIDAATAALFPGSFQDSPLGRIPKGWRVEKLGQVVELNKRSIMRDYLYETIKYVDISSVTVGRLDTTTIYRVSEAPSRAKRLVSHGDTIWSCVRPNHRSYLFIHKPEPNLVVSTGFAVLTPKSLPASYLYAWVTTDQFVDYLSYNADGSAYPAVRPDRFADADMLIPSHQILEKFEQRIGPLRDRIAHNDAESHTLAALRDALLPKLISGKLRVKDAEHIVGGFASSLR